MFGYVKCFPPELRLKEYEYYRGVYCGLCRSMGRCTGCISRMSLSYDAVFLALTRMALTGEAPSVKARRCIVHPLRKRPSCDGCASLDYSAYAGAILVWHKHCDDRHDTHGAKKLLLAAAEPFLGAARKRAGSLSELDCTVYRHMERTHELELRDNVSAEELADVSGEMLSDIFAFGLSGAEERLARQIGFHVGRWVYFIDAVDDYCKDEKNGEFNPFMRTGLPDEPSIRSALTAELAATETAVDLLPETTPEISELIRNILYLGTERVTAEVLAKIHGKNKTERRKKE